MPKPWLNQPSTAQFQTYEFLIKSLSKEAMKLRILCHPLRGPQNVNKKPRPIKKNNPPRGNPKFLITCFCSAGSECFAVTAIPKWSTSHLICNVGSECFAVTAIPKWSTSHLICTAGPNALPPEQHAMGSWKGSPLAGGGGFCGEFARQDIGNEPIRQLHKVGAGDFCSSLFGDEA